MSWRGVARRGAAVFVCIAGAGAVAGLGCSSSSSSTGHSTPSGCAVDASIATFTFPDAALGDAGGSALSCGACLNTSCAPYVQACDNDCDCLETTKAVLECGQDGGTAYTCTTMYASSDTNFSSLALCILESCNAPCNLNGVVDAGSTAPSTDAPSSDARGPEATDATTISDAAISDATISDASAGDASSNDGSTVVDGSSAPDAPGD